MTEYVATRWYRAPEIMLSWKQYSFAIDIWATGCILAELLGRMPLFPGKDYMDQLKRTLNYIGKPDGSEISHIRTERARQWVRNFPPTPRVDWRHLYPNADSKSIDLLDKMLQFSPSKRISVQNALKHKYLEQLHDASDEPIANFTFDMKFEQEFKDNTMEVGKSKAVLERELNWFQEFQAQRTKYILQVKMNRSPHSSSNQSGHSSTRASTNANTPSRGSSGSVSMVEEQQRINQFQAHVMQQHMPQINNNSSNQSTVQSSVPMTQEEIVERQRMNAFQAHIMQQQMMQQQQQQPYGIHQQFEHAQRTRSQSFPLMPSYQGAMHHSNSFGNNSMQQQGFVNNQQYMQHQQYLQHQQQFQHMQQAQMVQNVANQNQQMTQSGSNDNNINAAVQQNVDLTQSMNLD